MSEKGRIKKVEAALKKELSRLIGSFGKAFGVDLDKGEILLGEKRIFFISYYFFKGFKETLRDLLEDYAELFFIDLGRRDGAAMAKELAKGKVKKGIEVMLDALAFFGWGEIKVKEMELEQGFLVLESEGAPEAQLLIDEKVESEKPVCHILSGLIAGWISQITGRRFNAREVFCRASGAEKCVFIAYDLEKGEELFLKVKRDLDEGRL